MIQLIMPAFVLFDVHSIWQDDKRGRDPSLVEQLRDGPHAAYSGRCHTCAGCYYSHESTGSSCRIPGSALGIYRRQSAYGSDERKPEGAPNGGCYTTHGSEAEEDGSEAAEEERCSLQWRIHFDVPDMSILKTGVTDHTSSSEAAAATEDVLASYVAAGGEFEQLMCVIQ